MVKKYCIVDKTDLSRFPNNFTTILGNTKYRTSQDGNKILLSFSVATPDFLKDKKIYMSKGVKEQLNNIRWLKPKSPLIITDTNIKLLSILNINNHKLATGQSVFLLTPVDIDIIGISTGTYYVIKIDDNNIKLSDSYLNALNNNSLVVNEIDEKETSYLIINDYIKTFDANSSTVLTNNNLVINSHNFNDNIIIQYNSMTPIGGLLDNNFYFIKKIDDNNIQFINLDNSATTFTSIPISSQKQSMRYWSYNHLINNINLDINNNSIIINNHNLYTGYLVTLMTSQTNNSNHTTQEYFVIKKDSNIIQLATSLDNALDNQIVNLSSLNLTNSINYLLFS